MRTTARALVVVSVLLAAGAGCSSSDDDARDAGATPFVPESSRTPTPVVDLSDTEVCARVRAGVDAFNLGDIEGTLEEFSAAVPLAEQLAEQEPSTDADILLEAVRYYAAIPAEEYVEQSQTSSDFLRYKEFTLTECRAGGPVDPSETGIPA